MEATDDGVVDVEPGGQHSPLCDASSDAPLPRSPEIKNAVAIHLFNIIQLEPTKRPYLLGGLSIQKKRNRSDIGSHQLERR